MASEIKVRKAHFRDAAAITKFVNRARSGKPLDRMEVAERFGQVSFLIAEQDGEMVGLLAWQIENLVIRVVDFLIAPGVDAVAVGRALNELMESQGEELQAEAAVLYLPENPSPNLLAYWEMFGYRRLAISRLYRAWREAALEWNPQAQEAIIKILREDHVRRPL